MLNYYQAEQGIACDHICCLLHVQQNETVLCYRHEETKEENKLTRWESLLSCADFLGLGRSAARAYLTGLSMKIVWVA